MIFEGPETIDSSIIGIDTRLLFEYNTFGQLTNQCMSTTDNERHVFEPEESMVFTYDSKGRMRTDSSYSWDTNKKKWVLGGYNDYVYNSQDRLQDLVEAYVNFSTFYSKTTYTYDENGKKLHQIRSLSADKNEWSSEDKTEYTYLSNGLLYITTKSTFEMYDSTWMFQTKTESNYDDLGRDTLTVSYRWNNSSKNWTTIRKVENTFNANQRKTKEVISELASSMQMINESKVEYSFDSEGNLLSESSYNWDEDSLLWTGSISTNYTYDNQVGINDLIMPMQVYDFPIYSKMTGGAIRFWVDQIQDWYPIGIATFYYSSMEVMSLPKSVYTKPTWSFNSRTNVLSLDAANRPSSLQLFDIQGRKVASFRNISSTNFTLNHLNRGMYLIELELNGSKERGKLMVE